MSLCKAWKDAQEEAARNAARDAAVLATIATSRRYGISDDKIFADIKNQFGLTEQEAKDYMQKKSNLVGFLYAHGRVRKIPAGAGLGQARASRETGLLTRF